MVSSDDETGWDDFAQRQTLETSSPIPVSSRLPSSLSPKPRQPQRSPISFADRNVSKNDDSDNEDGWGAQALIDIGQEPPGGVESDRLSTAPPSTRMSFGSSGPS